MSTAFPRKPQKRTSKRRRDILDASLRCFLKHGVEAATIEQIRDASGASSGSIYHHFGSKQGIAVALYVEGMQDLSFVLEEVMSRPLPLVEGLRALIGAYFDWVSNNRDWALYLLRVATADLSPSESEQVDKVNRQAREALRNWLQPFVNRGEVIRLPEELYASLVYGSGTHFMRHWLSGRIDLDLNFAARTLADGAYASLISDAEQTSAQKSSK